MTTEKERYHNLIKELRDERYNVDEVYIGGIKPKDTIEEIIELEEPYYDADVEPEQAAEIVQEIYDIADCAVLSHLMDSAETEIPVYSLEKNLTFTKEEEVRSDLVDHVDMGKLIGLMQRNWAELSKLTMTEIRNAMVNIYPEVNPVVVEAAVDTALHVVRANAA